MQETTNATSELPQGWKSRPLQAVGLPKTPNVDPSHFPNEIFELYSVPSYPEGEPEIIAGQDIGSTKQIVRPGDVLLCKINPHIVRVWCVPQAGSYRQIASGEWIVVRSNGFEAESDYLRYVFIEPQFRSDFMQTVSGVGGSLMRARPKAVAHIQIPLPPLDEQRRIVAKLDALFAHTQRARAELARVPKLIERAKQAVLAKAFSGELTQEWREEQLQILATEWKEHSLSEIADVGTGSTPKKGNPRYYDGGTIPWVTSAVVNQTLVTEAEEMITPEAIQETNCKVFPVGTILVALYGEGQTRGRVSLLGIDAATNQALAAIRLKVPNDSTRDFITWFMKSKYLELRQKAAGGVQPNLNLGIIKAIQIPFPSLAEQTEIVQRIEAAFARIERMANEAHRAAALLDRLEQAALAKAFRGELSLDDADDVNGALADALASAPAASSGDAVQMGLGFE